MTSIETAPGDLRRFTPRRSGAGAPTATAGIFPFFRLELRRHLPLLAMSFLLLGALPVARRVVEGDWNYRDGSWNVWGAVLALYVMAPLMAVAMAASGWARERSLHLLEWLYARPLRAGAIFRARALAIATPLSLWSALALAVHRLRSSDLEQALSIVPGLPDPITLFVVGLGLALGAGLLASALAPSAEWAVRWGLALVVAVWAGVLTIGRSVGAAAILQTASKSQHSPFLDVATAVVVAAMALLCFGCAWRAMSGAPDGPGRIRRAATVGAPVAAALVAILAVVLNVPRLAGREETVAAWLGGDAGLVFAPARGVNRLGGESMRELSISHPIVRDDQRRTVLRDAYVMRFGHLVFDGEVWPDPSRGVALVPTLVDESGADWLLVDRSGTARNVHLPPFGDAFTIGWSPSAERFAWKWFPWPSSGASKSRRFAPLRIVLLDRDQSMRTIEVAGTTSYDTQVAWVDERTLLVTEYESGGLQRGWWRTLDADTAILSGRIELPEGLGLAAPALQQQFGGGRASRLPTLGVEPVALLTDRAALNLWYRPEEGVATPPRLLRLEVRDQALIAGRELPARSLASTLGNADDGSLVWAAPERAPRLPHWDGGSRSQIFRLRSFDAQTEPVCEVASGRLFRYLGQHRDWLVWSTPEFRHEFELWGCNLATGESRRLSEWEPWANPTVAIAEAGIFTPRGWMPLAAEAR